jgi:hypothetical protein
MKKHFVTFYSPGTFFFEETTKPINSWNVQEAFEMSRDITERYNAKPFGFRFSTRERQDDELDSKVTERSNMYYLGGKIFTLEEIIARDDPNDEILIGNMKCNGYNRVVENTNSWKVVQPFHDGDVLLV